MSEALRWVRLASGCLVWATLLAQAACSAEAASEPGAVVVRDSAGVRIVESAAPAWGKDGGWRVVPEPAVDIGADVNDSTQSLYGAADVERLGDGQLVVENRGSHQLLVYDSLGAFVEAVGREGEGPGEFKWMRGLYRCGRDTLVETALYHVSLFDLRLSFVRTETIHREPENGNPQVVGVSADCSAVLVRDLHGRMPRQGHGEWVFYRETTDTGARDTVGFFPTIEVVTISYSGTTLGQPVPWSAETVWAARGDTVYLGMSNVPEIRVVDGRGAVHRLIRWVAEPAPVTAADRARLSERRRARLRKQPQGARYFPPLDRFPVPEEKPLYSKIVVDDEGNLWIRAYPELPVTFAPSVPKAGDPSEMWTVFDPAGRWLGTVEMPAALQVYKIQGGYVIGRWEDELDVEHVRLHRIEKVRPAS